MKERLISVFVILLLFLFVFVTDIVGLHNEDGKRSNIFNKAMIRMDSNQKIPLEITFDRGQKVSIPEFFEQYRKSFPWSADNEVLSFKTFTDKLGQTHHRFKQTYKGVELAEVQYLIHEQSGNVIYTHGRLIHGLDLPVQPTLLENEALTYALKNINARTYMWENLKMEALLKQVKDDPNATYFPMGELKISAGHKQKIAANFRLVYRFDIFSERPFSRYYVDVDAHTGDILAKYSRINDADVLGEGNSLYNGTVPITVSDADYPVWPDSAHAHLSTWNAYGGSGQSWWFADQSLGNEGGYDDMWYDVIDTDPILINGTNPQLSFYQRYNVEPPYSVQEWDGFDGMNVRVSTNGGASWQILTAPIPEYTCTSLLGFASFESGETDIPGWAGQSLEWEQVTFDLSTFSSQEVQLRFAFASDYSYSAKFAPDLFGWQIDEIVVSNDEDTLFYNAETDTNMTVIGLSKEVTVIEGAYRLRESGRGGGVFTYNSMGSWSQPSSVDFIDDDSLFTDPEDAAGVQAHWGLESTYDYYSSVHSRDSFDDRGSRTIGYVNFIFFLPNETPNNAMWTGEVTCYGKGDGTYYNSFTGLDIVGHEVTHGVTQYSAGLFYANEPGALNESFSDIFGAAVEFYKEGEQGDWFIGEDACLSGPVLRSMQNPNVCGNPDTYEGEYWVPFEPEPTEENDYGGIHNNSSVQNFWFYLLSKGGSGVNDHRQSYSVSGIGIEEAEQIAYRNLTVYLMPTSDFSEARSGAIHAAIDLFGNKSVQVQAVIDAWDAVGVYLPFVGPYALNCQLNSSYQTPGIDTVKIASKINNPEQHSIEVFSLIESFDQTYKDTLAMFDDGMHGDSTAGDEIFGALWPVPADERSYHLHLSAESLDSGYYNIKRDAAHFTSIGPVIYDGIEYYSAEDTIYTPGSRVTFKLYLKNTGKTATATQITADISSPTPLVIIPTRSLSSGYAELAPDARQISYAYYAFLVSDTIVRDTLFYLPLTIYSNNYPLWYDSLEIPVYINSTENKPSVLPAVYALHQNFPNPFNPVTRISYQMPVAGDVELTIYNLLGQRVATLISERKTAGYHQVEWHADGLPSGIYYYRLIAGEFNEVKKMVLIK